MLRAATCLTHEFVTTRMNIPKRASGSDSVIYSSTEAVLAS